MFELIKEYFILNSRTAIATKLATSYVNLFLSVFARDLLDHYSIKPSIWLRYIDDVFMYGVRVKIYSRTFSHISTQLTSHSVHTRIFLDVLITPTGDGTILADLCIRPTHTH